ncbi:MAG: flagellin [Clostridia bacterium]|nr:flagellin [Clostridia bacterium]
MVIAHNISALNTYKSLGIAGNAADNSMEKLSSGYKINKAADDAAGLSISEKMRSQIRGLNQASTNAENGVSMIQTAEGALNEEHSILQRMRELAVQAATDTNASEDREALQSEMAQLTSEINRIGSTTQFNGMNILDGSKTKKAAASAVSAGVAAVYTSNTTYDSEADAAAALGAVKCTTAKDATATENAQTANKYYIGRYELGYNSTTKQVTLTEGDVTKELRKQDAAKTMSMNGVTFTLGDNTGIAKKDAVVGVDNSVYFHVGANSNQVINTEYNDMRAKALGISFADKDVFTSQTINVNNGTETTNVEYSLDITTRSGANNAIQMIDNAIKKVSDERSKYGAVQNRLEYTMNNLNTTAENMTAAESTIRDVDMAEEMMSYTKNNILQQAAQAMLVQANARPQQALQLLQG